MLSRTAVIAIGGARAAPGGHAVHADLARTLVDDGFLLAMPEHRGDNFKDQSAIGPESWWRRLIGVSHAIDVVGRDPRFKLLLALDKVGAYGMSVGGHTALSLAGGRWSPARLKEHCEAHIREDFPACVGLATRPRGDFLDGTRETIALWVIRFKLRDATWHTFTDPRVAAIVAGVPFAADFHTYAAKKSSRLRDLHGERRPQAWQWLSVPAGVDQAARHLVPRRGVGVQKDDAPVQIDPLELGVGRVAPRPAGIGQILLRRVGDARAQHAPCRDQGYGHVRGSHALINIRP